MIVKLETHFDAAHYLPNYEGKCSRMHGHTYRLIVEVEGKPNPKTGMVIDFSILKDIINEHILIYLDHQILNAVIKNPTAENIATWIKEKLINSGYFDNFKINVTVYEGLNNSASTGW